MHDELVTRTATPGLGRYVDRYWGHEHHAPGPARQRERLSTGVVLIFGLGPELGVVSRDDPGGEPAWHGSFVAGLDDACAVIEHEGTMRGVQVDLTPLAARMIFRESMKSLAREVVALEDLLGAEAQLLQERLLESPGWQDRFELIETLLAAKLGAAEPPPPDIDWAWRRLTATRGRLRIAQLAAELGCSRKHLAAQFREYVGLPPKLVARMLRFRHASDLLASHVDGSLAEVAALCGYYDQAHLDRDFRDFAATSPTAYRAGQVTFVQDSRPAGS